MMIPTRGAGLHEHAHLAENEVSWQQKLQLFREGVYASRDRGKVGNTDGSLQFYQRDN